MLLFELRYGVSGLLLELRGMQDCGECASIRGKGMCASVGFY